MMLSVFYDHILEAAVQSKRGTAEILKECHSMGIDGLEINYSFLARNKNSVCNEIRESKMNVSCIYESFDFGKNPDISAAKKMIETAAELKTPRVLIIPGTLEDWEAAELSACSGTYETAETYMNQSGSIRNMKYALSRLVEYAGTFGIQVTLEDYDGFTQPFARIYPLLWFMKNTVGLKYTLDTGNFAFSDENVMQAAYVLKEYIVHIHCKDREYSGKVHGEFCKGLGQCPAGSGYIPIYELLSHIKASGYNGYLAIEHFGVPDQLSYIKKSADFLKQFI